MRYINHQNGNSTLLTVLTSVKLIGAMVIFTGTLTANAVSSIPLDRIPQKADRIILQQEDVSPANVYTDALYTLQRMDYTIVNSEETVDLDALTELLDQEPLVFSATKQVEPGLAIRITANVGIISGGGELKASVHYADDVNTPIGQWKQATWTDGQAEYAFIEALNALQHAQYSGVDFETGVAVATR